MRDVESLLTDLAFASNDRVKIFVQCGELEYHVADADADLEDIANALACLASDIREHNHG